MNTLLPAALMIVALGGTVAMSALFILFGVRATTCQARITCFVLSAIALLPLGFIALLAVAVSED